WDVLQSLMKETTLRKNKAYIGTTVSTLVEHVENGLARGHSNDMKLVRFPSTDVSLIGRIIPVAVTHAMEWQLIGEHI
ncbi:MAG: hypothetical protein AAB879_01060, partial [Patescibacteria group bacterium]